MSRNGTLGPNAAYAKQRNDVKNIARFKQAPDPPPPFFPARKE